MASGIHRAERSTCCCSATRFGAQRVVVEVQRLHGRHQLVERPAPLGLEALADRGAPPGELGEPQLRVMQRFAVLVGAGSRGVELMLGPRHALVGLRDRALRRIQPRFSVGKTGHARLEVQLPRVHLRGKCTIGLLDLRQLGGERREAIRCHVALVAQPLPAIRGDLQARLRLCEGHLACGTAIASLFHSRFSRSQTVAPLVGARVVARGLAAGGRL